MIDQHDLYCFVDERRGFEYRDVEFKVVALGPKESTIRNTQSGALLRFYNAHLYSTIPQRVRSIAERREKAQQIGAHSAMSPKNRKQGKRR